MTTLLKDERQINELKTLVRSPDVQQFLKLMGARLNDRQAALVFVGNDVEVRWVQGRTQELHDWISECEKLRRDT